MIVIEFKENLNIDDSSALDFLKEKLNDEYIKTKENKVHHLKSKGDITISIELVALALSAIGTFISVLDYWKNQYSKYSISIKIGKHTFNRENLSRKEFEKELQKAIDENIKVNVEVSDVNEKIAD
jgi:hypothetical protein